MQRTLFFAAAAIALSTACSHAPRTFRADEAAAEGGRRLADAERASASGKDAQALARAGWLRYLVASDLAGAQERFEKTLAATEGAATGSELAEARALALCGLAELQDDKLSTPAAARAWAEAVRIAPRGPMGELAGLRLLDAEGDSQAVDDVVLEAARQLPVPSSPRTARLVREAAARVAARRDALENAAQPLQERAQWTAAGALDHWRISGPHAALRRFDLAKRLALDGPEEAAAPAAGPAGPTGERDLDFPDGDVGLELEPPEGDVYYAASEVTAARGGDYLAWLEGAAALELRVDGAVVLARSPYPRVQPRVSQVPVKLTPGKHSFLVRWSRLEGLRFRLVMARGDGAASDLKSQHPAAVRGRRLASPCALGSACSAPAAWNDDGGLRGFAARALEQDPDDPLAAFLLARATSTDDRTAARTALDRLVALTSASAPALLLHANALNRDPELPERVGRAKALAELTSAAEKAPLLLHARLAAATIQRESERYDDAAAEIDRAERAFLEGAPKGSKAELPPRLLLARARLLDARGNTAAARAKVEAALSADAGRCDARALLYDFARRDGSLEEQARLAQALVGCPDGRQTLVAILRERQQLPQVAALWEQLAAARPAIAQRLEALAEVRQSMKQLDAATALLRQAAAVAPRSADPHRRLSGLLDLMGDHASAHAERVVALKLSPGDLALRRQLALDDGTPLLAWADRDAVAAATTSAKSAQPAASAVRLLDLGAVEIFPDGGVVERVHTLVRVLDKKGISRYGEAHVPSDAHVLRLRTIKPDGTVLEPEAIPEKESISLHGLEVNDAIEIDYLRGFAPRGPELPGLSLGSFYFRDDETPMVDSQYEVRAPEGWPLEADLHNLPQVPLQHERGQVVYRHLEHDVAPLPPEPHAPGEIETMPWAQVGWGARQAELVRSLADWALLRTRPGAATDALAAAAGGASPREKAERIFQAVSHAVRGRASSSDFATPAAHVLSLGRGNRLVALKASLASAGIGSHVVLIKTFGSDPRPYRFPQLDGTWAVLRVDLPDGPLWIDPGFRFAPLGRLPAFARGLPGWVLPETGEEPVQVVSPSEAAPADGRILRMELRMDAEGAAAGGGRDEHLGFEAASLKDALERMDKNERKQAVEGMLARGLRAPTLEALKVERETDFGGSGTLVYQLRAQLGRKEGESLLVPSSLMPSRLSRRWVQKAERALPLLVDAPEDQLSDFEIQLPAGAHLVDAGKPVELTTPFGTYRWSAREEPAVGGRERRLLLHEELRMPLQRIAPADYEAFVRFARAVDQRQGQELRIAPLQPAAPTPVASP